MCVSSYLEEEIAHDGDTGKDGKVAQDLDARVNQQQQQENHASHGLGQRDAGTCKPLGNAEADLPIARGGHHRLVARSNGGE